MAVPNDPWGGSQNWNEENPSGRNWGVEAIQAPSAWEYNDLLSECVVGVIDNGFQTDHPDLELHFASDYIKEFNNVLSHGTHVAGTIGAISNNGIGVTGINSKAKIYAGSCAEDGTEKLSNSKINYNLAELVQSGAKVLNGSFGIAGSVDESDALVLGEGRDAATRMAKLLAEGYDFIFVQAAGNAICDARYNGTFCSVQENTPVNVDGITIQDILNRKIVVANATTLGDGTYELDNLSCWGKNVDIAAPGESIYSTTTNSGYALKSGTSMASPHVTGVVSLVWSANPDLTGPEVKSIVINSTCDTVASVYDADPVSEYKMLNAKLAVENALVKGKFTVSTSNPVSITDTSNVTLTCETEDVEKYSYRFGTILNGQEYVLSDGYQTNNSLQVNFLTAISGNQVADASAVGTHTLFVDLKDSDGKVVRKTIENYVVEGLKITSFEADKVSPQKKGTAIELSAVVENEGGYRYNTYKFSAIKDGVETNLSPYVPVDYNVTWTPTETGTYTLKYYIKDYLGQEATAEMEYTIYSDETAFVYYNNASWSNANIHYKVGDGEWTTSPGVAMGSSNLNGYAWCYAIDLQDASSATVCFNNGNNTWDSNGGQNYTVKKGLNGIGGDELAFSIKSITGTPTKSAPCYTIQLSGGIAPYTYSYEFINKATDEVISSGENCVTSNTYQTSPYGPRKSGEYTFNITYTDSYGQTATASKDYTLEPFTISDITASVNSPQLPNTEIILTAQYENEFIYKYGLVGNWTITNKTTNTTETFVSYYTNELTWTPMEIGEYEITVSTTDNNGETAEYTINYSVADEIKNEAVVYYCNDSFTNAYIHYMVGDGEWTIVPGVEMEENTSSNGYTWRYVIDLDEADGATVCFNDGNGNWDSNNGSNYRLKAGAYGIKNGTMEELQEGLMISVSADREVGGTYNQTTFTAVAENGTAPYSYQFAVMPVGSTPTDTSYTVGKTDGIYNYTPYTAKDYTVYVKVTDAEGNVAETSMNYTVEGDKWGKFTAIADDRKVGTPVTLEAEYINYKEDSYNNYSFIVEKDGVSNTYSTGSTGYYVWTPTEAGTYTITAQFHAYTGEVYKTELTYEVTNGNTATIYYNSGWDNAYIHYCVAGGSWTTVPGVAMKKTSEKSGYTYKYIIDLDDAESVIVCFNNGNGSWDSNNGANYTISAGSYGVSSGSISEVK